MRRTTLIIVLMIFVGCTPKAKPIAYGETACHYCSMTIVDQQHAAQLVTKKAKVIVFDAAECMLNHLQNEDQSKFAMFFVNDFDQPGSLIDATKATYLISKGIPSPMGEYLSAFKLPESAEKSLNSYGGTILTWNELQTRFKK
ncbi:MAG: hypothetical protein HKP38_00325 [Croceitalea sp.]|nr:nitrous oxide reductase accessory protein NosL [Croceitalea sp.]MBT8237495.1 nitrous oxide reductase accessory protein NosL [Croceitalea sp.]NNC33760.1 hypothetical protein [Croceitalea sp.]NNL07646.1 hypothetical protein [Croceitalea sp.]NNM17892.1 hypothetical protein [Croceitalea sp.]